MAAYSVTQSGSAISISSTAAGFTQNSNPYQYYLNSGGVNASPTAQKFTFTFADGGSFYLTDFNEGLIPSADSRNVVGIPSTADTGYGSTINVIGGGDFLQHMTSTMLRVIRFWLIISNRRRLRLETMFSLLLFLSIHQEPLRLERQQQQQAFRVLLSVLRVRPPIHLR